MDDSCNLLQKMNGKLENALICALKANRTFVQRISYVN